MSAEGAKCNCTPSVEAWAWDKRTESKIRKTFSGVGALAAAKQWRSDATGAVSRGTMRAPTQLTLREAAEQWLEGAKSGAIRRRNGDPFKPSTIWGYEQVLTKRVYPVLGAAKLSDISRTDLDDFASRMLAEGLDPSTIRNVLMPVRAVFRRALNRGEVTVNPTAGLELPASQGRRDRIVDPTEAARLLAELPESDRALWATAIYAGLRRGELLGLRWEDVDLAAGVIRVERSYDPRSGQTVSPKSRAGKRRIPIAAVLRDYLDEAKLRCPWDEGLVFGRSPERPFNHSSILRRARVAWRDAEVERAREAGASDAELKQLADNFEAPLALHEARHSYASMQIAAGEDAKKISTYLGHSSIAITFDRYGHLMPGDEEKSAQRFDEFLSRSDTAGRLEQLEG